jgi:hypothetical protein
VQQANDISAADRGLERGGDARSWVPRRKRHRLPGVARRYAYLSKVAHAWKRIEVRTALHARTEDGQHLGVLSREDARRDGRRSTVRMAVI